MNFPLILYRISGWTINVTTLFIAFTAIKSKNLWKGKYLFLGIFFCVIAISELMSSISALFLANNLFIEYLVLPTSFALKALYLSKQHKSKNIRIITIGIIVLFVMLELFKAFNKEGYKEFNTIGSYGSSVFFLMYSLWNLSLLIKDKSASKKLRNIPDFWFTATMFCIAFLITITTILADTSYAATSDLALYGIFISENIIKIFLYFGYYRGIKLLK